MGTLDKRYTSSSIAKMILSRLAFSAAVVAGQYADYYNNYADLDIDSIDKGFVFSSSDYTDDLGNKKNKNKNQQDFFGTAAKQQLDSSLSGTYHVNGHNAGHATARAMLNAPPTVPKLTARASNSIALSLRKCTTVWSSKLRWAASKTTLATVSGP